MGDRYPFKELDMLPSIAVAALAQIPLLQEKFPVEDHAWLRYKLGSWIKNQVTVDAGGQITEGTQTLTLKEVTGDDYTIEDTSTFAGQEVKPNKYESGNAVKSGNEKVTVAGKEYPCTVWKALGKKNGEPTDTRFWIPEGKKNPVRVSFKQKDSEGDMTAVSLDEKVTAAGRTFTCAKLEGKIRTNGLEGTITAWLVQEVPTSQVRMDLVLNGPDGALKIRVEAKEVHEVK